MYRGLDGAGEKFCLFDCIPSVPNYKTSQESWRVKVISSLTKIIERNIKIYDIKLMYYENITNKESNGT